MSAERSKTAGKRSVEDAEKTRADIIAAAIMLFSEKGFDGTSLREIATQAGLTHGTIRHHFGSKADIWLVVADSIFAYYQQALMPVFSAAQASGDYLDAFKKLVYNFISVTVNHPEYTRLIVQETRTDNARADYYYTRFQAMHETIEQLFLKAQIHSGALEFHTNDSFFYALMSLTNFHILHPKLGVSMTFPMSDEVQDIQDFIMKILFKD